MLIIKTHCLHTFGTGSYRYLRGQRTNHESKVIPMSSNSTYFKSIRFVRDRHKDRALSTKPKQSTSKVLDSQAHAKVIIRPAYR